jgi:hypothetical protein
LPDLRKLCRVIEECSALLAGNLQISLTVIWVGKYFARQRVRMVALCQADHETARQRYSYFTNIRLLVLRTFRKGI